MALEKIKLNLDDPETRKVWETVLEARREVASWPAWKRGEDSMMKKAKKSAVAIEPKHDPHHVVARKELCATIAGSVASGVLTQSGSPVVTTAAAVAEIAVDVAEAILKRVGL